MLRFWRNPLLILHVRSDLRPARTALLVAVSLVVCILIALGCWSGNPGEARGFWRDFYAWMLGCQYVMLGFWSAGTCGQAVARERELKTFDFLKTTRLTPGELLVGMLLGAPIVAYFIVACTLPISIVAGLVGGIRPTAILGSVVLLLAFNLFYSLLALLGSMLVEKSSSGAVGLLGLLANGIFLAFVDTPLKGFAAISIFPSVLSLHHADVDLAHFSPTVFGATVPCALLSVGLYVLLGAWLVLMIVRNLKRDIPQIQLLSRWQCLGLIAFWNLLLYAFLDTKPSNLVGNPNFHYIGRYLPFEIALFAVAWNAALLFAIGVAALSPHEKLKVWWRQWKAGQRSYFSPDGLPWPWLAGGAIIGYGMLGAEALGRLGSLVPLDEWHLGFDALVFGAFLVFITRDVLFLQWCLLTRMKQPVFKGILFLVLYNVAAGMVGAVVAKFAEPAALKVWTVLVPYALLAEGSERTIPSAFILAAMALQGGVCVLILLAIQRRLARPAHAPAAEAA